MNVFGENRAIRLAFFENGSMPTHGALKRAFSSMSVRTYKGSGFYSDEVRLIMHTLRTEAHMCGREYSNYLMSCEIAVLDASSTFTVLTVAKYSDCLKATVNWNPCLYSRLYELFKSISKVEEEDSAPQKFLESIRMVKNVLERHQLKDSVIDSFDQENFKRMFSEFGCEGIKNLECLIAKEGHKLHWRAETPST
jgi:hypothetical protein